MIIKIQCDCGEEIGLIESDNIKIISGDLCIKPDIIHDQVLILSECKACGIEYECENCDRLPEHVCENCEEKIDKNCKDCIVCKICKSL